MSLDSKFEVIVVGGGAIGCTIAYYLRSEGFKVALVDKGPIGFEASWASAGIVGPGAFPEGNSWFKPATKMSKKLYDDLNQALHEETGQLVGYGGQGTLTLAFNADEVDGIQQHVEEQNGDDVPTEILMGVEARQREPSLPENLLAAMLRPDGRFLDARNYTLTIAKAAEIKGVRILQGWPVTEFLWEKSRIVGVKSGLSSLKADCVINAAGAWGGQLDPKLVLPIFPDHGQIMALRGPVNGLRHTLCRWNQSGYITPRVDGRALVGATHEQIGFQKAITPMGLGLLSNITKRVLPELSDRRILAIWSGLRPATKDGLPVIGPDYRTSGGYLWATGHSSEGMMQAPATAKVIVDLVSNKTPRIPIEEVSVNRFQQSLETF